MLTKISIIGAGSAIFSLNLIKDICLTPKLVGSTVSLMDIDEERLENAYSLCRRYADEMGLPLNLEKTLNRRESMEGADFVILAALVGGHERLKDGWEIAKRHGYRFGGSLHIVHDEGMWINFGQLKLMESIMLDLLEVCPHAWFMLVSNPVMAGVTYLKRKYPQARVVGFCHGFNGVNYVAGVLGLEPEHIAYEVSGLNHFLWLTEFSYKGEDAYPILRRWVEEQSEAYFASCGVCDLMGPKKIDLFRKFGVFPIGDTGNPGGGTWPYWYHADDETQKRWKEDPDLWYQWYFETGVREVQAIREISQDMSKKVKDAFPAKHSGETMIPFIESIACDIPRVLVLNMLNDGQFVQGIPADFQVEIAARVSAQGVHGIKTKKLPNSVLQYALRDRVAPVEIELAAFENGSYEDLLQLVRMDPWTRSETQAKSFLQELLALPYLDEMREHYK